MKLTLLPIAFHIFLLLFAPTTLAHDVHDARSKLHAKQSAGSTANEPRTIVLTATQRNPGKPEIANHFAHFEQVQVTWDQNSLIIESNGLPNHGMMVGIRSWQQQVPVPQPYTGGNAWRIPLHPIFADKPISVRQTPLRGAIAIAVNGVPIFCALNNRGEDAYLLGELDRWGGHCGRGDDYHYHIAPVHLEESVGKGNPIAFALDGFPIYGYTEADGTPVGKLDEFNGQFDSAGNYHYHATKSFPYVNGGLRGRVTLQGDQIAQPKDAPLRPAQRPLRDARITKFESADDTSVLTYAVLGRYGKILYRKVDQDRWEFIYTEPNGRTFQETYQRRTPGDQPAQGGRKKRRPGPPHRF